MNAYQPIFNRRVNLPEPASRPLELQPQSLADMIVEIQERERNYLGSELHDNVGQLLIAAKLYLDMLSADGDDKKIHEKAVSFLQRSIDEIRKISRQLIVPQLKQEGLVLSVKDMIRETNGSREMNILFHYDKEIEHISYFEKVTLYRIIEEQLQYVLAHSRAKQVIINIEHGSQQIQLIICDDGMGFDTRSAQKEIALMNILERVKIYKGLVEIHSAPGHGCQLVVTIPSKETDTV